MGKLASVTDTLLSDIHPFYPNLFTLVRLP